MKKSILIAILVPFLLGCEKEDVAPRVETTDVVAISSGQFFVSASVPEKGSYKILDYGFIHSPYEYAVEGNGQSEKVSLGSKLPSQFSDTINYSNYYNYYYVRAYVQNTEGTVYGKVLSFVTLRPAFLGVTPLSASVGDTISINGSNFTTDLNSISITFNGTNARIVKLSSTEIKVIVPENISSYYGNSVTIYITMNQQSYSYYNFSIIPKFLSFSPQNGTWGTLIYVNCTGFHYPSEGGLSVMLGDVSCGYYSYSSNYLSFTVPYSSINEKSKVKVIYGNSQYELDGEFTMNKIGITSINHDIALPGEYVTLFGSNIYPNYYYYSTENLNWVKIGSYNATIESSTNTQITFYIPADIPEGTYDIVASNGFSTDTLHNALDIVLPRVVDFTPKETYCNSNIEITGSGFVSDIYPNVSCDLGYLEIVNWDYNKIIARIPWGWEAGEYDLSLNIGGSTCDFPSKIKVLPSKIESFNPTQGTPGSLVEIKGKGLPSAYYTSVYFGTTVAPIISLTDTLIKAQVPSNSEAGPMKISLKYYNATLISDDDFTVIKE